MVVGVVVLLSKFLHQLEFFPYVPKAKTSSLFPHQ